MLVYPAVSFSVSYSTCRCSVDHVFFLSASHVPIAMAVSLSASIVVRLSCRLAMVACRVAPS